MANLFIFACAYVLLIVLGAAYAPVDDYWFFEKFDLFRFWYGDRFYILDGIEQYGIAALFGPNPTLFYVANAIEFLLFFYLILKLIKIAVAPTYPKLSKWLPYLIPFTPGVGTVYFRLLATEKVTVICLCYAVLFDLQSTHSYLKKVGYYLPMLVSFFLKETMFLIYGGISFFRTIENKNRKFHIGIIATCIGYFTLYWFLTHYFYPPWEQYGNLQPRGFTFFLKNVLNYFLTDPALFLFVIPAGVHLATKKIFDAYILLPIGYLVVFLFFGLYQEYYMLPLLPFILVAWARYGHMVPQWRKIALVILIGNSILVGLAQISIFKHEPRGFVASLEALKAVNANHRHTVCYLGLQPDFSGEVLRSSGIYYRRMTDSEPPTFIATHTIQDTSCDFIINSPFNYAGIKPLDSWREIGHYKPKFYIPSISIRSWIKYWVAKKSDVPLVNQNIFRKHDFIVFSSKP